MFEHAHLNIHSGKYLITTNILMPCVINLGWLSSSKFSTKKIPVYIFCNLKRCTLPLGTKGMEKFLSNGRCNQLLDECSAKVFFLVILFDFIWQCLVGAAKQKWLVKSNVNLLALRYLHWAKTDNFSDSLSKIPLIYVVLYAMLFLQLRNFLFFIWSYESVGDHKLL